MQLNIAEMALLSYLYLYFRPMKGWSTESIMSKEFFVAEKRNGSEFPELIKSNVALKV